MQLLEISKGKPSDVENTLKMFVSITDNLLLHGIKQWNYDYPNLEILHKDVGAGTNYVIRDGQSIVASIALDNDQDEQYRKIHWKQRCNSVLVIHRLGVHPNYQGKGLGKKMCLFAEEYGRAHNFECIRLDAYAGNAVSNRLYLSLGYRLANGYCYFHKRSIPFYCFEKNLKV